MTARAGFLKGDKVRIKDAKLYTYRLVYAVTREDVFEVAHIARLHGRRCLYLAKPGRADWIPVWATAATHAKAA